MGLHVSPDPTQPLSFLCGCTFNASVLCVCLDALSKNEREEGEGRGGGSTNHRGTSRMSSLESKALIILDVFVHNQSNCASRQCHQVLRGSSWLMSTTCQHYSAMADPRSTLAFSHTVSPDSILSLTHCSVPPCFPLFYLIVIHRSIRNCITTSHCSVSKFLFSDTP